MDYFFDIPGHSPKFEMLDGQKVFDLVNDHLQFSIPPAWMFHFYLVHLVVMEPSPTGHHEARGFTAVGAPWPIPAPTAPWA